MVKYTQVVTTIVCWLVCHSLCLAHPGHGTPGTSDQLVHYLTEPIHTQEILTFAGIFTLALFIFKKRRWLSEWLKTDSKILPQEKKS